MDRQEINAFCSISKALTDAGIEYYEACVDYIPQVPHSSVKVYSFSIPTYLARRAKELAIPGYKCVLIRGDVGMDSYMDVDWQEA